MQKESLVSIRIRAADPVWLCFLHLSLCTTQSIKASLKNKVTDQDQFHKSLVPPCFSFFLSLLCFLICNILSSSLSKSLCQHCFSFGFPWILWGLDPGSQQNCPLESKTHIMQSSEFPFYLGTLLSTISLEQSLSDSSGGTAFKRQGRRSGK